MTKLWWGHGVLFRKKKSSFYNIVLEKRKNKQEGFWARKLMFATHVVKDAEKWVVLSGVHQSMTENWNPQLFIFGCYLCVAKSWMPCLHLPPSPKPQKPQPNRHVPSHPSKTVLLFEVTVPLVVGRSLVYLFILVPIARTPASHAACFCAWPNAVNISQGGECAERARTAEPPPAAAPGAEERPAAGEDTGSKQTCSPAVWFALAVPVCGCLDMMCACDVSLLPILVQSLDLAGTIAQIVGVEPGKSLREEVPFVLNSSVLCSAGFFLTAIIKWWSRSLHCITFNVETEKAQSPEIHRKEKCVSHGNLKTRICWKQSEWTQRSSQCWSVLLSEKQLCNVWTHISLTLSCTV